jgi:hypothetical protein
MQAMCLDICMYVCVCIYINIYIYSICLCMFVYMELFAFDFRTRLDRFERLQPFGLLQGFCITPYSQREERSAFGCVRQLERKQLYVYVYVYACMQVQ